MSQPGWKVEPGEEPPLVALLEDDDFVREVLAGYLRAEGVRVVSFSKGADLLAGLPEETAVVCLDLGLEDMPGLHVLQHLHTRRHDVPVIVVTAQQSLGTAIELMRAGAYNYLTKPVDAGMLRRAVAEALERHLQILQVSPVHQEEHDVIGRAPSLMAVLRQVERLGDSSATVSITGESGTGKELLAQAIHRAGKRRGGPFVAVNCGAIPATLLEAELFGFEKGSFTGATGTGRGCFERAHGGTLFLDEVAEMPLPAQVSLLRALQERKIRRIGGHQEIPVDVRIVCATNRDLQAEVKAGRFREDLYFRLVVFPVRVPPLRERLEDIPLLVGHFLAQLQEDVGGDLLRISEEALQALQRHAWPGNIRELKNVVHRAMLVCDGPEIGLRHLPAEIQEHLLPEVPLSTPRPASVGAIESEPVLPLRELEHRALRLALKKTNGNISQAAKLLQIGRATLYRRIQELNLQQEEPCER
ncbi:MAG: sigma-54 dependent transcriptional regulator [Polyangiaceae bacterium]|jgi:DNA-binding NtrC family response regulator|nr:sigma-54 dependent transcriptional regulator [Polyangiaceae bacterium]